LPDVRDEVPENVREVVMEPVVLDYIQACEGFAHVVSAVTGNWAAPSPCPDWNARGVVEHVIGFNDVLLLRPLDAKPTRPKDDPGARWQLTMDALSAVLSRPDVLTAERAGLLGYLTTEVLVHTWDLAKATGVAVTLDPRLCQVGVDRVTANRRGMTPDMFDPPVNVPDSAAVQDRLLGLFGRDPNWRVPPD
jgi:uncharacterized protein (TIGR03086 family)